MARPKKNNADYFSHDNSMRNHRKIKALRNDFESDGYATYLMFLETLTESDNLTFKLESDLDWKLISSDFGIEVDRLKKISKEIEELGLITFNNNSVFCPSLYERLRPLFDKRDKSKELAAIMPRSNDGRFITNRTHGISVAETPQSKVKESKVKESKDNSIIYSDKSQDDGSNEINLVFKEFYELGNRGINFGNKTERKAAEWLLKENGFEKTINTIKYAMSVQGKPYSPSITTPYQLKSNLVKLMSYYKREKEPSKSSMPIFNL